MLQIFGPINQPSALVNFPTVQGGAIGTLLYVLLNSLIVIAGIYTLFNIIFAGYAFLSAGDDPKKVASAWAKIWQSVLGLAVVAGSFVLAAIFGRLIFGDSTFILRPILPTI